MFQRPVAFLVVALALLAWVSGSHAPPGTSLLSHAPSPPKP